MKGFSKDQRRALSEFCANFAVAWLAAGLVAPYAAGKTLEEASRSASMSVIWAGVLVVVMLFLTKGEKK